MKSDDHGVSFWGRITNLNKEYETMTINQKLIRSRMSLLELASYLQNVSEACRVMGYSRDTFYRVKKAYDEGGEAALMDKTRRKPCIKNRVSEQIEQAVVELAVEDPSLGQKRASDTLRQIGIFVSPGGVRSIWLRHNLETFKKRLAALEKLVAETGQVLSEAQLKALEKAHEEKVAKGEIETEHPGYPGSQDTYYVGTIKGVGRIYQQTFIDTYSAVGFAKLYTTKHPINSADMLNDRVIPFFDDYQIPLLRILTDRGTEYCGRPDRHEFQLYMALNDIDHTKTKVKHPQTNGICERFHKTIQNEFYAIAFRKKIYASLEELQAGLYDLDDWMDLYNKARPHQGKRCQGRTPMQTFLDTLDLTKDKMRDSVMKVA